MPEITYLEALRQGMMEEMERDESVFMLGEDIGRYGGAFKVTDGFQARFGEARVIDTPISEAAIVGAAAGAAHMGLRPIAEMQFMDFVACAYDILTNYVATARYRAGLSTPIVVRGPSGGYVRGGPFHSQNPEAGFFHTPGLKLVCPATARDAKGLIKAAIRDDDPVLYFEHKFLYRRIKEDLSDTEEILTPIGKARIAREGTDLSIVTWSAMVWKALDAAEQIEREDGASIEVLDLVIQMAELGVIRLLYTDISRDGTLTQPNYQANQELAQKSGMAVLASGGIAALEHVSRLKETGVEGAILGTALYTGAVDLSHAIEAARG